MFNFITLSRSPSQSQDQIESFKEKFEINLDSVVQKNFFVVLVVGDLNDVLSNWCKNDIMTTEV